MPWEQHEGAQGTAADAPLRAWKIPINAAEPARRCSSFSWSVASGLSPPGLLSAQGARQEQPLLPALHMCPEQPQSSSPWASACRQHRARTSSEASLLPAPNSHSVWPKMKPWLSRTLIHCTVTCTSLSGHFSLPWTDENLHGKNIHEQLQNFSSFFCSALEGKHWDGAAFPFLNCCNTNARAPVHP